jgi:hypothetical protein
MTLTATLAGYAADLFAGHTVVLSDAYLDALADHYKNADSPEAERWFHQLVTEPNPDRLGVLDAYVCYLRDRQPELLALLRQGLIIGLNADQAELLRVYKAGVDCSVHTEIETLDIRAAGQNGLHSVSLHVRRNVTRMEFWDRRVLVYCDALGHWTVDYQDSTNRPTDSECDTGWSEADALGVARSYVYATRVADLDVTASVIADLKAATHSEVMRTVKPIAGLTKPRAAVLLRAEGLRLELVSNALIYARAFKTTKSWSRVEHKTLLGLVLGGYIKIYKVSGALPMAHAVSGASTEAHYRLAAHRSSA